MRRVAAVFVMWMSFACGDGDVATSTSGGTSDGTTAGTTSTTADASTAGTTGTSSESSGASTDSSSDATTTSGPVEDTGQESECTPFDFSCPPGYACIPDIPGFGSCVPIPRGGCTDEVPCPEGFMCDHHFRTELGSCEPIESDTSSSGDSGTSTGA